MVFPPLRMRLAALAASLTLLTSCGAGVIGAVASSQQDDSGTTAPARPPELSMPNPQGPLVRDVVGDFRQVVISNRELPLSADVTIELRALGVTSVIQALILSGTGATTVVGFFLQTPEIEAEIKASGGQTTDMDVQADLAVLADGVEVAPPIPFLLLRQPEATLVPLPGDDNVELSVLGGTRVVLRVSGLRAEGVDDLDMLVVTLDPALDPADPMTGLARECTNVAIVADPGSDDSLVSGDAPGNAFPAEVLVLVRDAVAGPSTQVSDVFYVPEVGLASPGAGPTDGGTLVALTGQAMVPLDFDVSPVEPDFDQVTVLFRKGGREVALQASELRREESSLNRLVFPMPPSPDGRPGKVEVVLRVTLGFEVLDAEGSFVYGHRAVTFGPRGAVLNEAPLALDMASIEDPMAGAPDAVLLTEVAGVPHVQLYSADENGMFTRLGLPLQAGENGAAAQRDPVSICAGDFNGDSLEDLLVINRGLGTIATHTMILGQGAPAPPLRALGPVILGSPRAVGCALGDLNGDGVEDVVVLPGPLSPIAAPEVFLGRPGPVPSFVLAGNPPVGVRPFEKMALEDLDQDGVLDLVLASGGSSPRVVTAYGIGDGQFEAVQILDLEQSVPGYTPDARSGVVGVHADGTPASIAVVFAGVPGSGITEPTVAVLAPSGARTFALPAAGGVLTIAGADTPLGHSVVADISGDPLPEMILAATGESAEPLRLLVWQGEGFVPVAGGVEMGAEIPSHIASLRVGVAAPGPVPRHGVFATHRVQVDAVEEHRVSTWLVAPGPRLLAADASRELDVPIGGIASGNFTQSSSPGRRDLALASSSRPALGEILILANDGLGATDERVRMNVPGILPETLTASALALPPGVAPGSHSLVCLRRDGQLQIFVPVNGEVQPKTLSIDLLPAVPAHLQGLDVSGASTIGSGDVDGDGAEDLVVLARFAGITDPQDGDAVLLILRGKPPAAPGDSPLFTPGVGTAVHGNSSDFALGNFALEPASAALTLEVAMAVPVGSAMDPLAGNHIRFLRYEAGAVPSEDRLVPSFANASHRVLLAGAEPRQLEAADADGNGVADLLVSSGGDGRLRLFLNNGIQVSGQEREVNIDGFREGFATPRILPPGEPSGMILSDLNGDEVVDVLVVTRQQGSAVEHTAAYYLSTGLGDLDGPFLIPMSRTGNRVGVSGSMVARDAEMVFSLADFNGDGRADLSFGWDTTGPGDRNLRLLFGGAR